MMTIDEIGHEVEETVKWTLRCMTDLQRKLSTPQGYDELAAEVRRRFVHKMSNRQ